MLLIDMYRRLCLLRLVVVPLVVLIVCLVVPIVVSQRHQVVLILHDLIDRLSRLADDVFKLNLGLNLV